MIVGYKKNGRVFDCFESDNGEFDIQLHSEEGQNIMRHTLCHILAHALFRLYNNVSFGIGPTTDNGGFYIVQGMTLSIKDFPKISQEMNKIIDENIKLTRTIFKNHKVDYLKQKIIDKLGNQEITVYEQGDFYDICKGPHVQSTGLASKHFELIRVSEVLWENEKCQKIEFIAFNTQEDLIKFKEEYKQKELYDHRNLIKQMDLGMFSSLAPGFAFWSERGYRIYNSIIKLIQKEYYNVYEEVKTPIIFKNELWENTGHFAKYKENMFVLGDMSIKPMNCPGHALMFGKARSYKELPVRIAEFGHVCRKEDQGGIQGLKRTLAFTIDDAHIFCAPYQLSSEIQRLLKFADKIYTQLNITKTRIKIATRPEQRIGTEEQWNLAEQALIQEVTNANLDYIIVEGDGAFYGPKIEIQIQDNMNKWWTCGTIQIDYFLAERLEAQYIDANQQPQYPIIIHRAILGSIERFIGVYLEYTKGKLPFIINPCQFAILSISEKSAEYANLVAEKLKNYYCMVDNSSERIGKKIQRTVDLNPFFVIVVGETEIQNNTINIQFRNEKYDIKLSEIETFISSYI